MYFYRVSYTIGDNNERVYPEKFRGIACNLTQDHFTERVMIAGTDTKLDADGTNVIELAEEEAHRLMEEYRDSHPQPQIPFPPMPPGMK